MGDNGRSSWWLVTVSALRAVLTASVLVALYYLLPLDLRGSDTSVVVKLGLGAVVFLGAMTWQLRAITRSDNPALRALEGLFVALPLFLVLCASTYYLMSRAEASNFTESLSRTDALYFTVTTFSTVGYGDISAQTEAARLVVTAQIMLDLVIIGVGIRIITNVVQRSRERLSSETTGDSASQ